MKNPGGWGSGFSNCNQESATNATHRMPEPCATAEEWERTYCPRTENSH